MKALQCYFPASLGEWVEAGCGITSFVCSYAVNCYNGWELNPVPGPIDLSSYTKVNQLIQQMTESLAFTKSFSLRPIERNIPVGIGMGSSTADLAAVGRLVLEYSHRLDLLDSLRQQIVAIEPTDSLIYPGICLMNPFTGSSDIQVDTGPAWPVVAFYSSTKRIVTADFYQTKDQRLKRQGLYERYLDHSLYLYNALVAVLKTADWRRLFTLADASAQLNQWVLAMPYFEKLRAFAANDGIIGYNIAHSGSLVAYTYDDRVIDATSLRDRFYRQAQLRYYDQCQDFRMVASQPILVPIE